ncbi:MAG: P63C domain-containing protein [Bifidobacterium sp.]|uniref:P63C domain-containing protein n=1 Tax=Bifidobacterium fermentum TaxID=3059035 RepID=A0AB39UGY3_9BIFI
MAEREKGETAEYGGELHLAEGIDIPCGVMKDGTRLLSERQVSAALGNKRGGSHWIRQKEGNKLPVYVSAGNLKPYISAALERKLVDRRIWRAKGQGGFGAYGIDATSLPEICDVFLKARRDHALLPSQEHIALQAEILMAALAKIGVVALVDEATGYQSVRQHNELELLLSKYISEELQPWAKRFPDEFYSQMFKLKGWDYINLGAGGKKPRVVGKIANDIVYDRLPSGVLESLKKKNPSGADGHRKHHHHQFLTEDIGNKHLEKMIGSVITLMRASGSWSEFTRLLDRAYPKHGAVQGELTMDD